MARAKATVRLELRLDTETAAELDALLETERWREHSKASLIRTLIHREYNEAPNSPNPRRLPFTPVGEREDLKELKKKLARKRKKR